MAPPSEGTTADFARRFLEPSPHRAGPPRPESAFTAGLEAPPTTAADGPSTTPPNFHLAGDQAHGYNWPRSTQLERPTGTQAVGYWKSYRADICGRSGSADRETKNPEAVPQLEKPGVQHRLSAVRAFASIDGTIGLSSTTSLTAWPDLLETPDEGFRLDLHARYDTWLPCAVMLHGRAVRALEHHPVLMPWPRLFREWDLSPNSGDGLRHAR